MRRLPGVLREGLRGRGTGATSLWKGECSARQPSPRSAILPGSAGRAPRDRWPGFFGERIERFLPSPGGGPGAVAKDHFRSQVAADALVRDRSACPGFAAFLSAANQSLGAARWRRARLRILIFRRTGGRARERESRFPEKNPDRKSTRLNSSHLVISYAVFCLKKKKYAEILTYVETL